MRNPRKQRAYSEDFKREKVLMWESGKITPIQMMKMHGVSSSTLYRWRRLYGKIPIEDLVVTEKESEYLKNIELQQNIEKLQNMIGRQQMKIDYLEHVVDHANKLFETDIEKKFGQT